MNTVNLAPTWRGTTLTLPPIVSGSTPAGATVSSVFGSLFHDVDGASAGIAVTGVSATKTGRQLGPARDDQQDRRDGLQQHNVDRDQPRNSAPTLQP